MITEINAEVLCKGIMNSTDVIILPQCGGGLICYKGNDT